MANFNLANLKSKFIFVDLAFKCALHFHLDFCLQTIFLPVSVRYTSWSHQSIYDAPSLPKYDKSLLLCGWKRPWAIWGDSCNLIGQPNGQDGPILLGWDRPSWKKKEKDCEKKEKDCVERTYQVRDFFTMSAMKSQNSEEKIKHLKNLMVSRSCYKYNSVSFLALEINKSKSFLILIIWKIFRCINNPSMTKLVRSR